MLAYKVVEKGTRHCSNWAIHKSENSFKYRSTAFHKKFIQYFPRYLKNTTVYAVKGTVGILTFNSKIDAKCFISCNNRANLIIIKVKGIGEPYDVKYLNAGCGSTPEDILNDFGSMVPPRGTIAFESVKVLE